MSTLWPHNLCASTQLITQLPVGAEPLGRVKMVTADTQTRHADPLYRSPSLWRRCRLSQPTGMGIQNVTRR